MKGLSSHCLHDSAEATSYSQLPLTHLSLPAVPQKYPGTGSCSLQPSHCKDALWVVTNIMTVKSEIYLELTTDHSSIETGISTLHLIENIIA